VTEITRTKQNVLVVDDQRVMRFEATYARRLEVAEEWLYSQAWDEVWLDHDLDMSLASLDEFHKYTDYGGYNIRPLIRKIEEDAHNGIILPVGMFVIHTGNPVGQDWIAQALLPWYTVGVTSGHSWSKRENWPKWAKGLRYAEELEG